MRRLLIGSLLLAGFLACGSENLGNGFDMPGGNGDGDGGTGDPNGFGLGGGNQSVASIAIDPPTAAITVENGAKQTQPYKVVVTFADNTKQDITGGVTWTATNQQIGGIAGSGVYTTTGNVGGQVKITAQYQGKQATAALTVKLHVLDNPANLPSSTIAVLRAATTPDPAVQWAYPYDGTVFPRGLAAPLLMWNGGGATDSYYVHITSDTYELESFGTAAPPARYVIAEKLWDAFVESTSGNAAVQVARHDGTNATVIGKQGWKIAPASMRGTIYYWANNLGRVMRIKPGAAAPDDFSAGKLTGLPDHACTMTCHTVSADGSTIVSGGDTLGGSYDLLQDKPIFDTGGAPESAQKRTWSNAALSPNGKYLVQNGNSSVPGPPGAADGLWNTADGTQVAGSGLEGKHLGSPAFSPDGARIAYVDVTTGALSSIEFDLKNAKAGAATSLVDQGTGGTIQWPSVTPDGKWVVYHRGSLDSRFGPGDLFLANATAPNQEIRLGALDGDNYPFVAGARDLNLNYEPTFAPVPSGGYFWVVFTSRRTYGNQLVDVSANTKQLWVAAIDLAPAMGKDPSHPAFLLTGQANDSLNMRGFWALDPCKADGASCGSGTECCGGFCDGTDSSGKPVCNTSSGCAQDGDHCDKDSDCCNAAEGSTCIAHVCAEPGPK